MTARRRKAASTARARGFRPGPVPWTRPWRDGTRAMTARKMAGRRACRARSPDPRPLLPPRPRESRGRAGATRRWCDRTARAPGPESPPGARPASGGPCADPTPHRRPIPQNRRDRLESRGRSRGPRRGTRRRSKEGRPSAARASGLAGRLAAAPTVLAAGGLGSPTAAGRWKWLPSALSPVSIYPIIQVFRPLFMRLPGFLSADGGADRTLRTRLDVPECLP